MGRSCGLVGRCVEALVFNLNLGNNLCKSKQDLTDYNSILSESDHCERGVLNIDKLRIKLERLVRQRRREQRREEKSRRKSSHSLVGVREYKSKEQICLPPPEAFQDDGPLPPEDFRDDSSVFDHSERKCVKNSLNSFQ